MRACMLAALPSRAFPPPCERDARAPSTRDAGNAGVPPAMPTAREKTYPFERGFLPCALHDHIGERSALQKAQHILDDALCDALLRFLRDACAVRG